MGALRGRVLIVLVVPALVLLVGCGPTTPTSADRPTGETAGPVVPSADDPVTSAPPTDDPVTSAPPTGDDSIAPDGGGGGGPSLSLPRLPVGGTGAFVDDSQDLQCATISWTAFGGAAGLDHGIQVEVVGYQLDTTHFSAPASGCEQPSCEHYVFGSDSSATGCTVGVRTVRPQPPGEVVTDLVLVGKARCAAVSQQACGEFIAAVKDAAGDDSIIDLAAPDLTSDPSPSESPSASESPSESADPSSTEPTA